MKKLFIVIFSLLFISYSSLIADDRNLELGNPTNAIHDIKSNRNYLIEREQYSLSYDNESGIPNWVSWHLGVEDMGDVGRTGNFYTDNSLPDRWYKVKHSDYTNGGLDRGHMCPSADRTKTIEDNKATFFMTNIVPQTAANNRGAWANFENYLRDLVRKKNKEIYIVAGVYASSGTLKNEGRVRIPLDTWKIAVVLENGNFDISRINEDTDVIAIVVPNKTSLDSDWKKYIKSVGYIEHLLTYDIDNLKKYDFLSEVPDEIEKVIENKKFDGVID